jgi:ferredoxin
MPKIIAEAKTFEVAHGTNLREALLDRDIHLYSEGSKALNCYGYGICGACVVLVEGAVSQPTTLEKIWMTLPTHSSHKERRLACKVKVLGDVSVTKFDGYFGSGEESIWTPDRGLITTPN